MRRFQIAFILAGVVLLGWFCVNAIFQPFYCGFNVDSDQLSSLHLAQSFAFLHGFKYPSLESGVFLSPIYGPVGICYYWPAALFALPSNAILAAHFMAAAIFFIPIFWLFSRKNRPFSAESGFLAFLVFAITACTWYELRYSVFGIHVDAPALGLAATAACLLYDRRMSRWRMVLSALCVVLSVWSKQTLLPVAVAIVLYVWMVQGKKAAIQYLLALALSGVLVTLVIFHFFDARDLWLNLVTVPLRHPWASFEELIMVTTPFNHPTPSLNKWESAWKVISELFRVILIPCILLLLAVFNDVKEGHFKQGFSRWMASNPWLVFVLMGVLLLPSAFLGRVKIGGGVNNYGLSLYFLLTAALLATLRKRSGIFLLCALIALLAVQNRAILLRNPVAPNESRVATDMAWRFALRHPGEVYYPGIPLASVMAEKKAYHSSVGVWEREAARIPLGRSQFSAGLPAKMKWIVLGPSYGFMPILVPFSRRFRDISITEIQELPGWVAFVKDHA